MSSSLEIRKATESDLPEIARIQSASPEAAQWNPADYRNSPCLVASDGERVLGFLTFRNTAVTETELLNLAVDPGSHRRGIGRSLMQAMLAGRTGEVFLEVRESNQRARKFYESLGFREIGRRPGYYQDPVESGIVMKFLSC